jgi:dihydroorotate dehydrogenase
MKRAAMISPSFPARLASAAMPFLRALDPETAHRVALSALAGGWFGQADASESPALAVGAMGLAFGNPLGLAAGFDKDALAVRGCFALGFGAVEVGTVTPRPQAGNPRPRIFRLPGARAVINRMGFPNAGWDVVGARLAALRAGAALPGPLGINIGINKDCADPAADYAWMARSVAPLADWITVNVSSPNTPGLRDLQSADRLGALLDAVRAALPAPRPIAVKIAPDLDDAALDAAVGFACDKAQALVISNTTVARPASLDDAAAAEKGGLSGPPLLEPSTRMLAKAFRLAGGRIPLIGVGGVASAGDALRKIRAGATLVQLYTALAWDGPALPARILADLSGMLARDGVRNLSEIVGIDA